MSDSFNQSAVPDQNSNLPIRERILKLVIIGKPAVGKTSLRRQFIGANFRQNYLPTLGADFSLYIMDYKNQRIKTTLWDLSGQTRFFKVHPQYYVGSHGAIVLYDIHSENPEEELISWIDTYIENKDRNIGPVLIIQNKIDLIESQDQSNMNMKHEKLIRSLKIYYKDRVEIHAGRTSAKTGENVDSVIEEFIRSVTDHIEQRNLPRGEGSMETDYTEGAYIITFENLIGPVIVTKSPPSPHMNYSPQEVMSVVNLSAGINLEELVESKFDTGTSIWSAPESFFYYVSFVVENENARGNHDLYLIGVNVSRDLKNLLADSQHLIEGHLLSKMNRFSDFLNSRDYTLSDEEELIRLSQSQQDHDVLLEILSDLREEIDKLVREKFDGN